MRNFCEELRRDFPDVAVRLELFPSGAAMLDVQIGDETWVMEFAPSLGVVGVSRSSTATFGWEGYENIFENVGEAKTFVLSLIRGRS